MADFFRFGPTDAYLTKLVGQFGPRRWSFIASHFTAGRGRVGKQCRERWGNHLDPDVSHSPWTLEEERVLMAAHVDLGNCWVEIAKRCVVPDCNSGHRLVLVRWSLCP